MAIDIVLPDLGEGIETGDVLEVLVAEGDVIDMEQGVVELETDKATVTVPSTHAGTVSKVHVADGDSVKVGAALVTVEPSEAAAAAPAPAAAPPKAEPEPEPAAPEPPAAAAPEPVAPTPAPANDPPPAPQPAAPEPVSTPPAAAPVSVSTSSAPPAIPSDVAASPAVRRFAREVGVDLTGVVGTGPGGRISRDDVLNLVRSAGANRTTAASTSSSNSASTKPSVSPDSDSDKWGPIRIEKMAKIRKTIANKMHESWSTVPRVTNFDDADVTDLEEFRQSSKEDYKAQGIKLTTMPFLIKAVAMALRHHPTINSSIDMDAGQIIYKDYVNVGIAVDTDRGLVVPSLRNADTMSIPDIARGLAAVAENARTGNFAIEDLRGSTFTISNLGAIGGTYSTPIINVPETAILLVGRSRKMPVVIGDEVKIRLMMPLSISYDHRLIDGGTAARFLNDVIGYLKAPSRLLLAL